MRTTVILGYGNEMRGDDGIGPIAARTVDAWGMDGVRGIALHQLTPEIAATLAEADRAVFVDASVDGPGVGVRKLTPDESGSSSAHAGDPARLLGLARTVFGRCPAAWYVTVPAKDMAFREGLTPEAQTSLDEALEEIRKLTMNEEG